MDNPEKPKNRTIIQSGNTTPMYIYPKKCKSGNNRETCLLMFIVALFTIANLWKQLRSPKIDEWIKKI
jgi:hypothetical protein